MMVLRRRLRRHPQPGRLVSGLFLRLAARFQAKNSRLFVAEMVFSRCQNEIFGPKIAFLCKNRVFSLEAAFFDAKIVLST